MLVRHRGTARIVHLARVPLIMQHAPPCRFGLLRRLLHPCELTFVSTSDADAVSVTGVLRDCHTLPAASFLSFAHLLLVILSDLAGAAIVPLRLFHIGNVHGALQWICEARWGRLVEDRPEVVRTATGRRARHVVVRWVRARLLNAGELIFEDGHGLLLYDTSNLFLYDASDLLLENTSDCFGDNLYDFSLHDLCDFLAHYLTHLFLHRSLDFLSNGMYDFVLYGDLQLLLHDLLDLFYCSLFYLTDIWYLVDGLLNQRQALVDQIEHAGNSFRDSLQPGLLDIAAFVGALTRDAFPSQRASMQSSVIDFGARSSWSAQTCLSR